jgi:hypothetical protein
MSICEISGTAYIQVTGEKVHWEHINDTTSLKEFLNRKVELFNTTMIKLQLPYRFDYCWNDDRNHYQAVATIMESNTPPSPEWWTQNYVLVSQKVPLRYGVCVKGYSLPKALASLAGIVRTGTSALPCNTATNTSRVLHKCRMSSEQDFESYSTSRVPPLPPLFNISAFGRDI